MNYSVNVIGTDNSLVKIPFKTYEYPNLMELIIDTHYEDIGACLGKGLCGTCHVKIVAGKLDNTMDSIEQETLSKTYNTDSNSRLACQIMLTNQIDKMTFKIITDNKINL
ncbi:2Fe-2S iron-sulfur cluster-binding protein [Mariniflexile litorale]|uniref:2Fe-2S iron-sulfur cluster-binding protein n=1 Tax=Mariniflexile litorale TaxID=3045158 RepID=A0AAU7EFN6_9FLAO|nr:2Fe-2S iron-sulfur cluster-binding protein [Mariniflexile sp. KMM 9835]MDQ8211848.1 2Fe-2S iron-sulfur cluster-binding protein [Mariniflexile sp. KMM 9835]